MTITPDMAKAMLEKNLNNRPASKAHVQKLKQAMLDGHYRLTGDAIRFGADGRLYDGQHRLMACIEADKPFDTYVIENLAEDTMLVIDGGNKRSAADQLHIAKGIDKQAVDLTQMLIRLGVGNAYRKTDTDTLAAIIERHPIIATTAEIYAEAAKLGLGGNIPAAELVLRAHGYQNEADQWQKLWVKGDVDEATTSARKFRERLIKDPELPRGTRWPLELRKKHLAQQIVFCMMHTPPNETKFIVKNTILFPLINASTLMQEVDFATTAKPPMTATTSNANALDHAKGAAGRRAKAKARRADATKQKGLFATDETEHGVDQAHESRADPGLETDLSAEPIGPDALDELNEILIRRGLAEDRPNAG